MNNFTLALIPSIVAVVSVFVLGGLWYSVFFGKASAAERDTSRSYPAGQVYGLALVFNIVAVLTFGWIVGPAPGLGRAMLLALVIGIGFVGFSFAINYQGSGRSVTLLFVDAGFHVVRFALFGLTFGLLG